MEKCDIMTGKEWHNEGKEWHDENSDITMENNDIVKVKQTNLFQEIRCNNTFSSAIWVYGKTKLKWCLIQGYEYRIDLLRMAEV